MPTFTGKRGETFECVNEKEAEFLYQKMFTEDEYGYLKFPEGCTVVDVGGNIGMFSKYAALKCGPESTCYAFEPMPPLFDCLKKNIRPQDKAFNIAVGDKPGKATLDFLPNYTLLSGHSAKDGVGHYATAAESKGIDKAVVDKHFEVQHFEVEVVTLATALQELIDKKQRIAVLKIDVEGMEHAVCNGVSHELWQLVDQVVLEVHAVGDRITELEKMLTAQGFKVTVGALSCPEYLLGAGASSEALNVCLMFGQRKTD